jgi:hypothetical protein
MRARHFLKDLQVGGQEAGGDDYGKAVRREGVEEGCVTQGSKLRFKK